MAKARTPRTRWIEAGFDALAAGGPDAVRIEPLAKTLAVTKGGFYWYFDDREALLDDPPGVKITTPARRRQPRYSARPSGRRRHLR